jgi:anthranilate synthase component 2
LLDNRDSFVWNLAQAFQMLGQRVTVVRSDAITVRQIEDGDARAIALSPGPGRPEDAGVCVEAVRALSGRKPILGICLGHQAICFAFGARIERSAPCHGKTSRVSHDGMGLFRDLANPLEACRYHSLAVAAATLPDPLIADARTADGIVMSVRHRSHPTYGVQFHPESFRTAQGQDLLRNFLQATA